MTAQISDAINEAGAWITDFHQYSNLLLCINFQVPDSQMHQLASSLQATGLHLSQESLDQLLPAPATTLSPQDLTGTLQITFIHDDPDLHREVPAVPG